MTNQATVQETVLDNAFAKTPRFIVHVGPGLGQFHGLPEKDMNNNLTMMGLKANYAALGEEQDKWLTPVMLLAPEARRNEAEVAREVMGKFRAVRQKGGAVLTVMTFSENVLAAIIDAMVQVRFHDELAICFHPEADGEFTVHRLNEDGVLQNWTYGRLQALLDEDDLKELDFDGLTRFRNLTQ